MLFKSQSFKSKTPDNPQTVDQIKAEIYMKIRASFQAIFTKCKNRYYSRKQKKEMKKLIRKLSIRGFIDQNLETEDSSSYQGDHQCRRNCLTRHQIGYQNFKERKSTELVEDAMDEILIVQEYMLKNQIECYKYNYSLEKSV